MKSIALAWLLAALGLWAAGALAVWLPRGALPDVGLLAAVALGLHLSGVRGMLAAWGVGWLADLLSGGPLGVFAFASILAWTATRLLGRQLALGRAVALVPFAAALVSAQTMILVALGLGPRLDDPATLPVLALHAASSALCAPLASRVFGAVLGRVEAPEAPRGGLRLDAGAPLR